MKSLLVLSLTTLLLLLAACGAANAPVPACGGFAVYCGNGSCCPKDNVCGNAGFISTCPEGMCCFVGPDDGLMARRPTRQTPARTP